MGNLWPWHLNISPPFHCWTTHARLRLEAPGIAEGLDAETFRGFQLAGPLFLLTSFFIEPKGCQRPLGVAALEDKIVQQAVVTILNEIYEVDFKGFSYGFRPGRSPHQALDALSVGLHRKRVNWVLDADIRGFLDTASYCPLVHESCANSSGC